MNACREQAETAIEGAATMAALGEIMTLILEQLDYDSLPGVTHCQLTQPPN